MQFSGGLDNFMGLAFKYCSLISTHSDYACVSNDDPSRVFLYMENLTMTTPTNRFNRKKAPMMMNTTKKRAQYGLF